MEIKQQQISSKEQEYVLNVLARDAAKPRCRFLEVGSWCGDSTIMLGKVAKQNDGHVFCVDWWKGSVGTELVSVASIQDVFSLFWSRIRQEGLEDTVIPIRSDSNVASEILKEHFFDMVFIDADHRYEAVLSDIKRYTPLVKTNGGILCGHDCDGHISDFDMSLLEKGKDLDVYESIHCGVVLAVGTLFKDYSIDQGVWSIRATGKKDGWEPTNLKFTVPVLLGNYKNYNFVGWLDRIYGIHQKLGHVDLNNEKHRDHPGILSAKTRRKVKLLIDETRRLYFDPKIIGMYKDYNLVKWWNRIYGIHKSLGHVDLNNEKHRNHPGVLSAKTRQKVERLIDKAVSMKIAPELVGTYKNYNIVEWWNRVYGIHQSLGRVDLCNEKHRSHPGILSAETQQKLEHLIDKSVLADVATELVDTYKGYNIVRWWNRICGVHQSLGRIDFTMDSINWKNENSNLFIGDSYSEVKNFIDQVQCKKVQEKLNEAESTVMVLQKESAARTEELAGLRSELEKAQKESAGRAEELDGLRSMLEKTQKESTSRAEELTGLRSELEKAQKESAGRTEELAGLKSELEKAQKESADRVKELAGLRKESTSRAEELASLKSELEKTQKESTSRAEELAGLRSVLEKAQKESTSRSKQIEALTTDLERTQRELATLKDDLEKTKTELGSTIDILEKELRAYRAKYNALSGDIKIQSGHLMNILNKPVDAKSKSPFGSMLYDLQNMSGKNK